MATLGLTRKRSGSLHFYCLETLGLQEKWRDCLKRERGRGGGGGGGGHGRPGQAAVLQAREVPWESISSSSSSSFSRLPADLGVFLG